MAVVVVVEVAVAVSGCMVMALSTRLTASDFVQVLGQKMWRFVDWAALG